MLNLFDFTFNHQFYLTLSPFGPASPLSPVSPLKPCTSTLRYICTCHCIAYLYYPVWVRLTSFSAWFSWTYLLTHYSFYSKLGLRRPSISVLCVRLLLFLFHSSCFNIPQWDTPPHVFTKGLTPLCQTWVAASHDLWCTLTSCVERSLRFCPYMQKTCCTCRYWSIVCIYSCEVYLAVVVRYARQETCLCQGRTRNALPMFYSLHKQIIQLGVDAFAFLYTNFSAGPDSNGIVQMRENCLFLLHWLVEVKQFLCSNPWPLLKCRFPYLRCTGRYFTLTLSGSPYGPGLWVV